MIIALYSFSYLFYISNLGIYVARYNPNNSKLVLYVIYVIYWCREMQKREAYRVDIVGKRQAAIPGVLELAGNIGGP